MAWARWRLGHLFPYLPKQPGYNKRIRALAPQVARLLNLLIFESTSIHDELWLIGRGRHTEIEVEFSFAHLVTIHETKAVRVDVYETKQQELEAVGLSQQQT